MAKKLHEALETKGLLGYKDKFKEIFSIVTIDDLMQTSQDDVNDIAFELGMNNLDRIKFKTMMNKLRARHGKEVDLTCLPDPVPDFIKFEASSIKQEPYIEIQVPKEVAPSYAPSYSAAPHPYHAPFMPSPYPYHHPSMSYPPQHPYTHYQQHQTVATNNVNINAAPPPQPQVPQLQQPQKVQQPQVQQVQNMNIENEIPYIESGLDQNNDNDIRNNTPIVSNNGNDVDFNEFLDRNKLQKKSGRYGKCEDKLLRELAEEYPEHEQDWNRIAILFATESDKYRTPLSLKQRWLNQLSLKPKSYSERDCKNHDDNDDDDDDDEDSDDDIVILNDKKDEKNKKNKPKCETCVKTDHFGNNYWCRNDIKILLTLKDVLSLSWSDIILLYQEHPKVHIKERSKGSLKEKHRHIHKKRNEKKKSMKNEQKNVKKRKNNYNQHQTSKKRRKIHQ